MPELLDQLFLSFQSALAGRYSLERELGRGGMGIVYLAREVRLDRLVAIKLLPPELAAQSRLRERFAREARTAARLSHPNIVPIHTVDEVGDFVFYVMAYVDGETLSHRVASRGGLPPAEATRILREVAWALAYAHSQGVVHRDVKPENILIESASRRAMVADFGIAQLNRTSGTSGEGEVLGTPAFMSPEQASGEAVDGRSDLYSLGVVGYYMVTARLPFDAPNVRSLLAQQISRPPPALPFAAPGATRELGRAIERCLAKSPSDRYENGEALAEALGVALEVRPEVPAPVRVVRKRMKVYFVLFAYSSFLGGAFAADLLRRSAAGAGGMTVKILLGLGVATLAIGVFPLLFLRELRRLTRRGYGQDDLALAQKIGFERLREEFLLEHGPVPSVRQRVLRVVSPAAVGLALLSAGAALFSSFSQFLWPLFWVSGYLGFLTGMIGLKWRRLRRGSGSLWGRFWAGRVGRLIFRLAGLGLEQSAPIAANRPTEFAIGIAADALFGALPKETRRALQALPDVVRQLEAHAQRLRQRDDELNRMLADAGAGPAVPGALQERAAVVAELHAAAESAQRGRADIVVALETIRLDLLRLRSGAGSVEGLTADLSAAREVGEQTDRLVGGRHDVDVMLDRR